VTPHMSSSDGAFVRINNPLMPSFFETGGTRALNGRVTVSNSWFGTTVARRVSGGSFLSQNLFVVQPPFCRANWGYKAELKLKIATKLTRRK
jgi:hypothetical protein